MKNQRFRFKIIALLLVFLLFLACFHGLRTIPLIGPEVSLREAILRLTDQSASPPPSAGSPSPQISPSPSGSDTFPSPQAETQAAPSTPADTASSEAPPLSEALSRYFDTTPTVSPVTPGADPDPASTNLE